MSSPLLESTAKRRIRPAVFLSVFLGLVLLAGLALGVILYTRPKLPYHLADYEAAQKAGDDSRIIGIYDAVRSLRAELALMDSTARIERLDREAGELLDRIEEDAGQKSRAILLAALKGHSFSGEDRLWLEEYAGLAGRQMLLAVTDATALYFEGQAEEESFLHFTEELMTVPHLLREYRFLNERFDLVKNVKARLVKADQAGDKGSYYEEATEIQAIRDETDFSGLIPVQEYLDQRLERVWQTFYEEQIVLIREEMEHRRTYDAEVRIRKLRTWFDEDAELLAFWEHCQEVNPESVVTWWEPVEHLAIKPLIADPGRAFDGDRYQEAANRDLILVSEFEKALEELYLRDYVLVDSRSFVTDGGSLQGLPCPRGKKPLVLVLEDFYSSFPRVESGMAWRLGLDEEGKISGILLDADGSSRMSRDYSAIGVLEAFIEKHPDFSFNGATGVIALVGQYGLFGYPVYDVQDLTLRRDAADAGLEVPEAASTSYSYNREQVKKIMETLRANNWKLGSGTYGRLVLPKASLLEIEEDLVMTARWMEDYTGKLDSLYCPFGDHVEAEANKIKLYDEAGYTLQSGYGGWAYWVGQKGHVYVARSFLSGAGLRTPATYNLNRFFTTGAVIDARTRPR